MKRSWFAVFLSEVGDDHVVPAVPQILSDEPPMTAVWLVLAAQETPVGDDIARYHLLDAPPLHQRKKLALVGRPAALPFPVVVQQLPSRRELGQVDVVEIADRPQEVAQVVPLREASQLRHVVETHIYNPASARPANRGE